MSGDPISDYFSLAPTSANAYFRYTTTTSSSSKSSGPQRPVLPQPPRPVASSNSTHYPPHARYSGPVTAPQYTGNLSTLTQQHWLPQDQVVSSVDNPIDLTRSRRSSSTSVGVVPNLHRSQQQQEQGFGGVHNADNRPTDLSVLLKSGIQRVGTLNTLLQQQLKSSGAATGAGNQADLARLLRSNTQAASTFNALLQQQLLGSDATTPSVDNLLDLARFLKPNVLTLNGLPPPSQEAEAPVMTTSASNPIDLTFSLRSNTPVANALYRRLRDAKLQSPDGLCVIQHCEKRARTRGLCKLHGGGKRCSVDGCTRGSSTGGVCIRHGGGARCSEEGCSKVAQSNERCKAHGGGLRCQAEKCSKSSQGNGLCRQHGGGRWCRQEGCERGAQRDGLCSTHGGVRFCKYKECKKQDRGGGFCFQHGGGKRCEVPNCKRASRIKGKCPDHHKRTQEAAAKEPRATREPPMDQSTTSSAETSEPTSAQS